MIHPDHIDLQVDRIVVPQGRWDDKDETDLVTSFHAMLCLIMAPLWDAPFTFVCLMEDHNVDRVLLNIDDTYPPQFMQVGIEEVVKFHRGKLLAVNLCLEATTTKVDIGQDTVMKALDSKYLITIPANGNILVSEMHRDKETRELENEGKWNVHVLDHVALDPDGEIKAICRELQSAIKREREQRQ